MTAKFVETTLQMSKKMKHIYELKLVLIGLSEMLQCPNLSAELRPLMVGLIEEMINIKLKIQKMEEKIKNRKARDEEKAK